MTKFLRMVIIAGSAAAAAACVFIAIGAVVMKKRDLK